VKDYECHCGKYQRIRYKGIVCDRCGVEVTEKKVRRERMGHISLVVPVVHIWYFRSLPSKIGYLLGIPTKKLESIIYYERYVVLQAGAAENVTININGGTINGNVFVDATVGDTMQEGAVKVTGGTFTNVYNFYSYGDQQKADSSFSITGCIYTQDEPYYVDEGYVAVWNGNHYLVKEWIPVAKVGEVEYDNLGDAIEAADGEVIILVGDAVIAELGIFNINLNGYNLTAAEGFTLTIDEENNSVTVEKQKDLIYMRPDAWNEADGWFMAYFWGGSSGPVRFTKEGDRYVAEVPDGAIGMCIAQKSHDNDTLDLINGVLVQNGLSHQTQDINEINIGYTYTICPDGYGYWYVTCENE
jgi:DNA-directed RNA polymerase beta' subunit